MDFKITPATPDGIRVEVEFWVEDWEELVALMQEVEFAERGVDHVFRGCYRDVFEMPRPRDDTENIAHEISKVMGDALKSFVDGYTPSHMERDDARAVTPDMFGGVL